MDFLEKLYSNENFGLYLVIAIAVLVVLFFIVLFLGKKDEKKSKEIKEAKEKEKALVENNATGPVAIQPIGEISNNESQVAKPIETKPEPIAFKPVEEIKPLDNSVVAFKEVTNEVPVEVHEESNVDKTPNVVLNEGLNEQKEEETDETKEFDFEALADAINKELESIKESKVEEASVIPEPKVEEKPVIEEKPFAFPTFETVEPDSIPEQVMNEESIKPVLEEKPKMPNVFSSVYANPKEEKKEVVKPINKPAPFELPKMADLPKKVEKKPLETKEVPSFLDQIEAESYQIDK